MHLYHVNIIDINLSIILMNFFLGLTVIGVDFGTIAVLASFLNAWSVKFWGKNSELSVSNWKSDKSVTLDDDGTKPLSTSSSIEKSFILLPECTLLRPILAETDRDECAGVRANYKIN